MYKFFFVFGLSILLGCHSPIIPSYTLIHSTSYFFSKPVNISDQIIKLNPFESDKRIISQQITSDIKNLAFIWAYDNYNNRTCTAILKDTTSSFTFINTIVLDSSQFDNQDYKYSLSTYKDFPDSFLRTDKFETAMDSFVHRHPIKPIHDEETLLRACQVVYNNFDYAERFEPGILTTSELLTQGKGACRDLAWFLIQYLRNQHVQARYVSGYLVNLQQKTINLHAWAEAKAINGKWVGLDATSGLFIDEQHIPLAIGENATEVMPIKGMTGKCKVTFGYDSKLIKN